MVNFFFSSKVGLNDSANKMGGFLYLFGFLDEVFSFICKLGGLFIESIVLVFVKFCLYGSGLRIN